MKRTLIIAEAGVNHNGDLAIARKLIDAAARAGADYVKFQTFKADKLASVSAIRAQYQLSASDDSDITQLNMLRKLELNYEHHVILIDYCKSKKIRFLSSPFDEDSIEMLDELGIDLFKIPSGEITNLPYLRKIGSTNKEVILSTGMSEMDEIGKALEVLINSGTHPDKIIVLHCNTEYPTPFEDVNLLAMNSIRKAFDVRVGYSDHTVGVAVPIAAVALGADCIEKHFTLDRNMEGPDHKASLEPAELTEMIRMIRNVETALGNDKKTISASESKNKVIARKSIHLKHPKRLGELIQEDDLIMKRPGDGISPMDIEKVIGRKVNSDFPQDHKLSPEDLL